MFVIWPPLEQSIHALPCEPLNPSTGWLNTLYASKRNCAFIFSVKLKLFANDMSEKNARGPLRVAPGIADVAATRKRKRARRRTRKRASICRRRHPGVRQRRNRSEPSHHAIRVDLFSNVERLSGQ